MYIGIPITMNTGSIWGDDGEDHEFEDDENQQVSKYLAHIARVKSNNAYLTYRKCVDDMKLELRIIVPTLIPLFIVTSRCMIFIYPCLEQEKRRCAMQMLQDAVNYTNKNHNC